VVDGGGRRRETTPSGAIISMWHYEERGDFLRNRLAEECSTRVSARLASWMITGSPISQSFLISAIKGRRS
jgi:hypothetical protein